MKKALCFALMLPLVCAAAALADDNDRDSRREEFRKRMQEAIKKYDKDDDGKLNDGERRAMFESMREQWAERMKENREKWAERAKASRDDDAKKDGDRRPGPRPSFGRGPSGGPPSFGRGGPPAFGRRPAGPPSFAQRGKSDDKDGKCPHCGRGGDSDKSKAPRFGQGRPGPHRFSQFRRPAGPPRGPWGHHARGGHHGHGHHGHHARGHDKKDDDDRRGPPRRRGR